MTKLVLLFLTLVLTLLARAPRYLATTADTTDISVAEKTFTVNDGYFVNSFDDCEYWAKVDKECVNNPRFMWSKCTSSCISYSVDDDEALCTNWAMRRECTSNPKYIHVHCPRSCKMAIVWSPWVRSAIGMDHATITSQRAEEPCMGMPSDDLYSVSLIMNDRLKRFFAGEYQTIAGLSLSSPSEYLAMMGLTEAVLYSLRIHFSVLKNAMTLQFNASSDVTTKELQSLTGLVASSRATIDAVLKVVGRGYDSDLLMLHLQDWAVKLEESAAVVSNYILPLMHSPSSSCNPAEYPLRSPLTRLVADYIPTEVRDRNQQPFKQIIDATLRNGVKMPVMGLGTWLLQGQECVDAVVSAIRQGYRSIDTAEAYRNEVQVGRALQIVMSEGTVTRAELFIATKLSDESNGGFEKVQALVARQLQELQLTYIDLYMLHSPMGDEDLQRESWRALELLYQKKIIRALGVSNFGREELERLCSTASVQPMVVQNKVDVYHVGKQLDNKGDTVVSYAASQKILVVAYSTHSAYPFVMKPLDDPIVRYIAHHHSLYHDGTSVKVTPSQVLLRWAIQKGFAVIPRSSDPDHLLENYRALSMVPLSADEMNLLDALQYLVASPVSVPVLV